MQATQQASKNDAQLEAFKKKYQEPLIAALGKLEKLGFSYREIENYAILKSGLERNRFMGYRDAANKAAAEQELLKAKADLKTAEADLKTAQTDTEKKAASDAVTVVTKAVDAAKKAVKAAKAPKADYSGVKAVEAETGKKAQDFIDDFENRAGKPAIDEMWKSVNAATHFALKTQLESGNSDNAHYDELVGRSKYYLPLRGHDAQTASDRWEYPPDTGVYFSSLDQKAYGRKSRSESPFAYISQLAHSAIVSGNRNKLNQTLLRLAWKDKSGLIYIRFPLSR
jgi:hypothetical protein